MNYIKELERDREILLCTVLAYKDGVQALRDHTLLDKFREDTTIQVQDVRNWLDNIDNAATLALDGLSERKVKR